MKIDWASLIAGRKFTVFALFYFVFEGNFQVQAPGGAYIWRGNLTEGFLRYELGGLIFGGDYFRNFTVSERLEKARKKEFWTGTVKRATATCNLFCSIVQIELKVMLRVFFIF